MSPMLARPSTYFSPSTSNDLERPGNVLCKGRLWRSRGHAFGSVKAAFGAILDQGESKAALQRNLAAAEFVHDVGKVAGLERLLSVGSSRDPLRLIAGVGGRVLGQQAKR